MYCQRNLVRNAITYLGEETAQTQGCPFYPQCLEIPAYCETACKQDHLTGWVFQTVMFITSW